MDAELLANLTPVERVQAIEDWIRQQPGYTTDFETRHHFGGGVYEREIFVPAGSTITGKIHLTEHLAKLTSGTMAIYSAEGGGIFTGPITFTSQPGIKRIGKALTDCWFSNFHFVGDNQCIPKIEAMLVVDTIEQYEARMLATQEPKQIGQEGG